MQFIHAMNEIIDDSVSMARDVEGMGAAGFAKQEVDEARGDLVEQIERFEKLSARLLEHLKAAAPS